MNPEESVRVYDDHPPPSILRTYRTASQVLPPGEKVPQIPPNKLIQDLPSPSLPMRDRYLPLLNANIAIARADTVFSRLFSPRSDAGHTSLSGSGSVVSPSSQSHRTHLPLNAAPIVLPKYIDARRPVEAATWRPRSPTAHDVQELHAELAVLPISPPPIQPRRVRPDRSDLESPPPLPPKDPRRSSRRRELAHFQSSLVHDAAPARAVPTPNSVFNPERIVTSSLKEERSHHVRPVADVRELPEPQTPFVIVSHHLPTPRTNADALSGDRASSPRSRASVGEAVPTHTFSPEPTRLPHTKGSPRRGRGTPLRPSSFPLNYTLYSLPDARSPPTAPRADQILSPRRDS